MRLSFLIGFVLIITLAMSKQSHKKSGVECNHYTTKDACVPVAGCEWDPEDAEDGLLGECGEVDAEEVARKAAGYTGDEGEAAEAGDAGENDIECNVNKDKTSCEAAGCEWDPTDIEEDSPLGECGEKDNEEVARAAAAAAASSGSTTSGTNVDAKKIPLKSANTVGPEVETEIDDGMVETETENADGTETESSVPASGSATASSGTAAAEVPDCDEYITKTTCPKPRCAWVTDEDESECADANDVDADDNIILKKHHAVTSGSTSTSHTASTSSGATSSHTSSNANTHTSTSSGTTSSSTSGGVDPTPENEACDSIMVQNTCVTTKNCYWVENKCQGEAPENELCEDKPEAECNAMAGCTFAEGECEASEVDESTEIKCEHHPEAECRQTTGCFWAQEHGEEQGECKEGYLPVTPLKKQKYVPGMNPMNPMNPMMGEDAYDKVCNNLPYQQCQMNTMCVWDMEDQECEHPEGYPMGGMPGQYPMGGMTGGVPILNKHKTVSLNCSQHKTEVDCEKVRGCDFEEGVCVADEIDFECGQLKDATSCGKDTRCMWDTTEAEADENVTGECEKKKVPKANEPGKIECGRHQTKLACEEVASCIWESEVDDGRTGECDERDSVVPKAPTAGTGTSTHNSVPTEDGEEVDFECGQLNDEVNCNKDTRCFWDKTEAELDERTSGECKTKKEAPEAGKIECGRHQTKLSCEEVASCIWESEVDDGRTGECDERDSVVPKAPTAGTGTSTHNSVPTEDGEHCKVIMEPTKCNAAKGCFWDGECESLGLLKHIKLQQPKKTSKGSKTTTSYFWVYLGLSVLFILVVPFIALKCFAKYNQENSPGVYDLQLDEPLNEASFVV